MQEHLKNLALVEKQKREIALAIAARTIDDDALDMWACHETLRMSALEGIGDLIDS